MSSKPAIPKGTRDFTPIETTQRNYIFNTIRSVFAMHGFSAIETPAMENLSTLLGKYGDEGDKLLFRILNSGDFLSNVDASQLNIRNSNAIASQISEKGLRYDLTVPFARFVVQHQNEITFPFKRYQIQPVWRADRPQKGRYREFFQCDADVIGSDSIYNEFEMIQLIEEVFDALKIRTVIHVNNRKILYGIAEAFACSKYFTDITVAIDKLDKIGSDHVKAELLSKGLSNDNATKILELFADNSGNTEKIAILETLFTNSETGKIGLSEIKELLEYTNDNTTNTEVVINFSLARGLNYYTGAIFEVKAKDFIMGSICGGGRYDNLTGIFGMPGVSGVGISFGADRIFDIMEENKLFPENIGTSAKIMFVNFGKTEEKHAIVKINLLRKAGIKAILYPDNAKMKKQIQYASQLNIEYVAMLGEDEIKTNLISLKNLISGEQKNYSLDDVIEILR